MNRPVLKAAIAAAVVTAVAVAYKRGASVCKEWLSDDDIELPTDKAPYRIPDNTEDVTFEVGDTTVCLRAARSFFVGYGIFVYFPEGKRPTTFKLEAAAQRFFSATKGEFHLQPNPGTGMGSDDDIAVALITAGPDAKWLDAPRIDEMATVLEGVLKSLDHDRPIAL